MEKIEKTPNFEVEQLVTLELQPETESALSRLGEFVALHGEGRAGQIGDRIRLVELPVYETSRYNSILCEIRDEFRRSEQVSTFFLPLKFKEVDGRLIGRRYIGSVDNIRGDMGVLIGDGMTVNHNGDHVRTVYAELAEQNFINAYKSMAEQRARENGD